MTLFGKTLGPQEIASLVFMLGALVIWFGALRGERRDNAFFRRWNAERKARRDAERRDAGETVDDTPPGRPPTGPWG